MVETVDGKETLVHDMEPASSEPASSEPASSKPASSKPATVTKEDAASRSAGTSRLIASQHLSLLLQFVHPRVRADLLNGKFGIIVVSCRNVAADECLRQLDLLRQRVLPSFQQSSGMRDAISWEAVTCLEKLTSRVPDILVLSADEPREMWSYGDWSDLLESLTHNFYWASVAPSALSLDLLTVKTQTSVDPGDYDHHSDHKVDLKSAVPRKPDSTNPGATRGEIRQPPVYGGHDFLEGRPKFETLYSGTKLVCSSDDFSADSASSDNSLLFDRGQGTQAKRPYGKSSRRREIVAPGTFIMNGWQSLRSFLISYERYFYAKFEGSSRDCTQHLVGFLPDAMKTYYTALGANRLRFPDMKRELMLWYNTQERHGTRHWKGQLREMTMTAGESLKVYAMRLQEISCKAYPKHEPERIRELRHQFLETVPSDFARHLQITQDASRVAGQSSRLSWGDLLNLADKEDERQRRRLKASNKREEIPETWFSRPETKNMQCAVACCREPVQGTNHQAATVHSCQAERRSSPGAGAALLPQYGPNRVQRLVDDMSVFGPGHPYRSVGAVSAAEQPTVWPTPLRSPDQQAQRRPPRQQDFQSSDAGAARGRARNLPPCNWCGKMGHGERNCWERQGACRTCGNFDHRENMCPNSQSFGVEFEPVCPVCRGAHIGRDCEHLVASK